MFLLIDRDNIVTDFSNVIFIGTHGKECMYVYCTVSFSKDVFSQGAVNKVFLGLFRSDRISSVYIVGCGWVGHTFSNSKEC